MVRNGLGQLKAGALISYTTVAFNAVAGLLYTPWMIFSIGSSNYGLYTLALSIVNFFMVDFGLSDAVSRFLSNYYAEGRDCEIRRFLGIVYKIFLIIAVIIAAVLFAIFLSSDILYSNLSDEELHVFKILFAVVSLYSVIGFPLLPFKGILLANEQFVGLNICNLLQKVTTVFAIIACLILGLGVYALVFVNATTALVFSLIRYLLVRFKTTARADFSNWNTDEAKRIFSFSVWVTVVQLCQRMIFAVAPSVIAMFSSSEEVALFGLAASLEGYVYTLCNALNGMFIPKVSRALLKGEDAVESLMLRVGRIQQVIIGYICLLFFVLGDRFVHCWVGDDFALLYPCAALLIIPSLIELPQLIGDAALVVGSNIKSKAIAYLTMAGVNIVGLLLLVGLVNCGALGACFSICIAYLIRTVIMGYFYSTKLHINMGAFFWSLYKKWTPVAVVVAIIFLFLSSSVASNDWVSLIVLSAAFSLVYFVAIFAVFMNKSERQLITGLVKRQ